MFSIDHRLLALGTMLVVLLLIGAGAPPGKISVPKVMAAENAPITVARFRPLVLPGVRNTQRVIVPMLTGDTEMEGWCVDLLTMLAVTPQRQNVGACVAWTRAEGTFMTINNPLNTTQDMPNQSGIYNSHGVKIYPDRATGLEATVITFGYAGHGYENILAALHANDGNAIVHAIESSDWGTGGGAIAVWETIQGSYQ